MNKTTVFYLQSIFVITTLLMLIGCSVIPLRIEPAPSLQSATPPSLRTASPPPSPTGTILPYIHYSPSEKFNTHLEFDYPSWWFFQETKLQGTDIIYIGMSDPRSLTVPTRTPEETHGGTPSDFGNVSITIDPPIPGQSLDEIVEPFQNSNIAWAPLLNYYELVIDGHNAFVFEYQVEPFDDNGYSSLMFERVILFIVENQLYQIVFVVAEKDRGGDFEQGYEYFFKSIKIVP